MSRIPVTKQELDDANKVIILPIEKEVDVNGVKKMVKIEYLAEITNAKLMVSKSGKDMLKLSVAIDAGVDRAYLDTFMLIGDKIGKKILSKIVDELKLDGDNLDTDDLLGKFMWVQLANEEVEFGVGEDNVPIKALRNKISFWVRAAREDELNLPPKAEMPF